jgi:hypothetical protein
VISPLAWSLIVGACVLVLVLLILLVLREELVIDLVPFLRKPSWLEGRGGIVRDGLRFRRSHGEIGEDGPAHSRWARLFPARGLRPAAEPLAPEEDAQEDILEALAPGESTAARIASYLRIPPGELSRGGSLETAEEPAPSQPVPDEPPPSQPALEEPSPSQPSAEEPPPSQPAPSLEVVPPEKPPARAPAAEVAEAASLAHEAGDAQPEHRDAEGVPGAAEVASVDAVLAQARDGRHAVTLVLVEPNAADPAAGGALADRAAEAFLTVLGIEDRTPAISGARGRAILLPGVLPKRAREAADEVRRLLAEQDAPEGTLSIGIAGFPRHARSGAELIRACSLAVAAAAELGGDTTVVADEISEDAVEGTAPNDETETVGSGDAEQHRPRDRTNSKAAR